MPKLVWLAIVLGLGLVALVAGLLVASGDDEPVAPRELSTQASHPSTPLIAPPADVARDADPLPPAQENAESFLTDYWGEDWPRIEAELRKMEGWEDYDLKKLPLPVPLDVAIPKLREELAHRTPEQRQSSIESYLEIGKGSGRLEDHQWILARHAQGKTLGEAEFLAIRAHVGPSQQVLEDSAARIIDAIHSVKLNLFDRRDFTLGPYSTAGTVNAREWKPGLLFSISYGYEGWAAGVMVLESDVPGYTELRAENLELIRIRNRELEALIATF